MNNLLRNVLRPNTISMLVKPQIAGVPRLAGSTRSIWHLSKQSPRSPVCMACNNGMCSCGKRFASSSGEKALVEYLEEEIVNETNSLKGGKDLPTTFNGFQVKYNGADVELTKKEGNETIEVAFNVNHSVDAADNGEDDLGANFEQDSRGNTAEQEVTLQSKPTFEVNIVRGDTTLSLSCTFLQEPVQEGEYADVFGIEEVLIFKGEHKDAVYAASGDMLDGYFYDLLMNLLAEKKVDHEFASSLSELATQYEQTQFINLLKETKKFFQSK